MKGVILAGGRGTRLRPITHTGPKQMIPVANKPVLQHGLETLREADIHEVGIVLGNKGREEIVDFVGNGSRFGLDVTYILQGDPRGLAHAVGCVEEFVDGSDFLVYLGDNLLESSVAPLVDRFERGDHAAGIALCEVENPSEYGIADVDEEGNIVRLVEKPTDPPSNLAIIGLYAFSSTIFEMFPELESSDRGEFEITDAIQALLDAGHTVGHVVIDGWWKDAGYPHDILAANRFELDRMDASIDGTVAPGASVSGPVELHRSARVNSGADVVGPVSIGPNTVVGAEATVGPYTSIGEGSVIERGRVENSVVMSEVRIDTARRVMNSLVGSQASIVDDETETGKELVVGEDSKLVL